MKLTKKDVELKKKRIEDLKKELYNLQRTDIDKDDNNEMGFGINSAAMILDNQKRMVMSLLVKEEDELRSAEIVDLLEIPDDIVGLNDIINVVLQFAGEEPEEEIFQITDTMNSEYTPVSTSSPIGLAIYGKPVGSVVTCKTPKGMLTIHIESKNRGLVK